MFKVGKIMVIGLRYLYNDNGCFLSQGLIKVALLFQILLGVLLCR